MKTVLVVEDEIKIREVIVTYLQHAGYETIEAATGEDALQIFRETPVDLVLLDLMLPDIDGEDICREIRSRNPVPLVMLTAKSSLDHRLQGLSLGADDYIVKPFEPSELVARVRAVLRRTNQQDMLSDRMIFREGGLMIDALKQEVTRNRDSVPASLTPNEYKLLIVMARHPLRTFSRDELIGKVFGFDYDGDARTIDQHIKNLRQKIEPDPKKPIYIQTVYGSGYRFNGGPA